MIFFFNGTTIKAFGLGRDPSRRGFLILMQGGGGYSYRPYVVRTTRNSVRRLSW